MEFQHDPRVIPEQPAGIAPPKAEVKESNNHQIIIYIVIAVIVVAALVVVFLVIQYFMKKKPEPQQQRQPPPPPRQSGYEGALPKHASQEVDNGEPKGLGAPREVTSRDEMPPPAQAYPKQDERPEYLQKRLLEPSTGSIKTDYHSPSTAQASQGLMSHMKIN